MNLNLRFVISFTSVDEFEVLQRVLVKKKTWILHEKYPEGAAVQRNKPHMKYLCSVAHGLSCIVIWCMRCVCLLKDAFLKLLAI